MNNVYFKDIPHIHSLSIEQILFSFENVPIIFVCINDSKERYLCVCDDIIDEESWLIVKISNSKLLAILKDKDTILSAFKNQNVIIATRRFGEDTIYNFTEYNSISRDELPLSDQYLEMKDNLKEYIQKISNENMYADLDLEYVSTDSQIDNYVLTLDYSLSVCSIPRKYLTSEFINDSSNTSSTLLVDYEKTYFVESNEFKEESKILQIAA